MFKIVKYLLLVRLYKKAKINIMIILVSMLLMIVVNYVFSDLLAIQYADKLMLLVFKWLLLFTFIGIVILNIRKCLKIATSIFAKEENPKYTTKKERILDKTVLMTRSEQIINKYKYTQ